MWRAWIREINTPGIWASPYKGPTYGSALAWVDVHEQKLAPAKRAKLEWVILKEGETPMGPSEIQENEFPSGSWTTW